MKDELSSLWDVQLSGQRCPTVWLKANGTNLAGE